MTPVRPPRVTTILVAEDDPAVRRLAHVILTQAGYDVLCAEDGIEALAVAESNRGEIALLLSDVRMPRLGGLELARAILTKRPSIKIVLMSANAGDLTLMDPAWLILEKPFRPAALVKVVRDLLKDVRT